LNKTDETKVLKFFGFNDVEDSPHGFLFSCHKMEWDSFAHELWNTFYEHGNVLRIGKLNITPDLEDWDFLGIMIEHFELSINCESDLGYWRVYRNGLSLNGTGSTAKAALISWMIRAADEAGI
jgi:hypothetical protein